MVIDWLTIPIRNIKSFKRPFDLVYCCPNLNVNASFYMRIPLPDTLVAVSETSDVPSRAHGRGGGRLASCTLPTCARACTCHRGRRNINVATSPHEMSLPRPNFFSTNYWGLIPVTGVIATSISDHHCIVWHHFGIKFVVWHHFCTYSGGISSLGLSYVDFWHTPTFVFVAAGRLCLLWLLLLSLPCLLLRTCSPTASKLKTPVLCTSF